MTATDRRMAIFHLLDTEPSVSVAALSARFSVSPMTIRRDLASFERQGLITTTHGGAYKNTGMLAEPSFSLKSHEMTAAKSRIAEAAAAYIRDGERIIIDCGTTTLQIARYITDKKLTVITNSWPLVSVLGGCAKIELLLLPGVYDEVSAGAFGEATIGFLSGLHADKVFLGTHGLSLAGGASVPTTRDAETKRALHRAARESFLLADHTKWAKTHFATHTNLDALDHIIMDHGLGADAQAAIRGRCPDLILA